MRKGRGFGYGFLAGAGFALGTLAYAYIATHPPRFRVRRTPTKYGMPEYEAITFPSTDGLTLAGWFIPPPHKRKPAAVLVLCHGYPMNRTEMLPYARFLHEAGYALLLFDFRALGESEGEICSIGYHECEDLAGALDYLKTRPDTRSLPVGVLGHSLGGAVAIMTAARDDRIEAVVAESPYPDMADAVEARFRYPLGPLSKGISLPAIWWAKNWLSFHPADVSPLRMISAIGPRPVLLISGQKDLLVRWQDVTAIYAAASEPRELWLLKASGHARCLRDEPDEYARRAIAFFRKYLPT